MFVVLVDIQKNGLIRKILKKLNAQRRRIINFELIVASNKLSVIYICINI